MLIIVITPKAFLSLADKNITIQEIKMEAIITNALSIRTPSKRVIGLERVTNTNCIGASHPSKPRRYRIGKH
jgi:hypothetical protein